MSHEPTKPWGYVNEQLREPPGGATVKVAPAPAGAECSEPSGKNGKWRKAGSACLHQPHLLVNGKPVCAAHLERVLRRLVEPSPNDNGGGI